MRQAFADFLWSGFFGLVCCSVPVGLYYTWCNAPIYVIPASFIVTGLAGSFVSFNPS